MKYLQTIFILYFIYNSNIKHDWVAISKPIKHNLIHLITFSISRQYNFALIEIYQFSYIQNRGSVMIAGLNSKKIWFNQKVILKYLSIFTSVDNYILLLKFTLISLFSISLLRCLPCLYSGNAENAEVRNDYPHPVVWGRSNNWQDPVDCNKNIYSL